MNIEVQINRKRSTSVNMKDWLKPNVVNLDPIKRKPDIIQNFLAQSNLNHRKLKHTRNDLMFSEERKRGELKIENSAFSTSRNESDTDLSIKK
jgi:hypothetical protein